MSKESEDKEKKQGTLVDGIAASEHLDSSGERIEIKGIDISSLTTDGVMNWEHKSDEASQLVGKIIYAKKILESKDCETERQQYFWDKIKTPYLYIIGELFDAVNHQGAKDVAAMLRYDSENKKTNKNDTDSRKLINFSIEGQKLEKRGSIIKKCIARRISITATPCNKVCEAEELESNPTKLEKGDKFKLVQDLLHSKFKQETSTCQIMKNEFMPKLPKTPAPFQPKRTFTPKNTPNKLQSGDRIDFTKQPKPKTGKDIWGTGPKFNAQGKQISAGQEPKPPKPTPAQAMPDSEKPKASSVATPRFASTNRLYGMMKNNMRKAIIASAGISAQPGTQTNNLQKEVCQEALQECTPKIDLIKKPKKNKPSKQERKEMRDNVEIQDKHGYTAKDAQNRTKLRNSLHKKDEPKIVIPAKEMIEEHERVVRVLESKSHKDDQKEAKKQKKELKEYRKELNKSEIDVLYSIVKTKCSNLTDIEQQALIKTVLLFQKQNVSK